MKYLISKLISKNMQVKERICNVFRMVLYEKPLERVFLIMHFMALMFLGLFRYLPGGRIKEKSIEYSRMIFRKKIFRHPQANLYFTRMSLRVCVTYKCNTSCKFCYASGLDKEFTEDMSLSDFTGLMKWLRANGWKRLIFLGGEPTAHAYFEDMLDICYREGVFVTLFSNGLFNERVLKKLRSPFVGDISINYPEEQFSTAQKEQCLKNLEYLAGEKFDLSIADEVDGKSENWKELVKAAMKLKVAIRWSLILPGYSEKISTKAVFDDFKLVGAQLIEILETCIEKNILCYVLRPVPVCIFTSEQFEQIKKMGKYLIYTRCILGFRGDYTTALTINPDLSTYLCNNFYAKGPPISYFKDRDSINSYYEKIFKENMVIPPIKQCSECAPFGNFLSIIKDKKLALKECLSDGNVCQAGCIDFRHCKKQKFACSKII